MEMISYLFKLKGFRRRHTTVDYANNWHRRIGYKELLGNEQLLFKLI